MNALLFRLGFLLTPLIVGNCCCWGADGDPAAEHRAADTSFLLKPAFVFDVAQGQARPGWSVLVTGHQIAAVGPAAQVPAAAHAEIIELPEMTLLPGLMDIHSHIFLHPYNEASWDKQVLNEPLAYRSVEAVLHVRSTLLAGFTLLRDLGTEGAGAADVSIKRAIEEGLIPGPRMLIVTKAIVATASYGPGPGGYAENVVLPKGAQEASGIPEILRAVREQCALGADWIKVYADYARGRGGKQEPNWNGWCEEG